MILPKGWPRMEQLFLYLGMVALIFLCGTVFGLAVLNRWSGPSTLPASDISFVTVPPAPSPVGPEESPWSGDEPAGALCEPPPAGWRRYIIQPDDTLSELAAQFEISQGRILRANCLTSLDLQAGQELYLPPLATPAPCLSTPPAGWGLYPVQAGDTLSSLAEARGIAINQVRQINCLTSDDIVVGQLLHLPVLATPTPCVISLPVDWEPYTVQSADTLSSLARARETTVEKIMQVNCLSSQVIRIGDTLYLPALPTPVPTEPPPPTLLPTPDFIPEQSLALAPSSMPGLTPVEPSLPPSLYNDGQSTECLGLNCGDVNGDSFSYAPGGGNDPNFVPCVTPRATPWLEFDTKVQIIELGQRRYFYVCGFSPSSGPAVAKLTWPDGLTQQVELLIAIPNPDLNKGEAQAIIDWPALPFYPTGRYTMTVTNSTGSQVTTPFPFKLKLPERERILVVPPAGPPGTIFQTYYVSFTLNMTATFDFYAEEQTSAGNDHDLTYRRSWSVYINQPLSGATGKGWAQLPLLSIARDSRVAYTISYNNRSVMSDLFRLR